MSWMGRTVVTVHVHIQSSNSHIIHRTASIFAKYNNEKQIKFSFSRGFFPPTAKSLKHKLKSRQVQLQARVQNMYRPLSRARHSALWEHRWRKARSGRQCVHNLRSRAPANPPIGCCWLGIKSTLVSDCASDPSIFTGSNMAAGQEVERPVLAAVGCLKLVAQPELPLVLQLEPDDGLTQGIPVLTDHTEGGTCGRKPGSNRSDSRKCRSN